MCCRSCRGLIGGVLTCLMLAGPVRAQQLDINRVLDLGVEILRTMPSNAPQQAQPAPQQAQPAPQPAQPQRARAAPPPPDPAATRRVREIQTLLSRKGYDPGPIDGAFGPRTAAAIRAFEADHGMPQRGQPSAALLSRLAIAPDAAATPSASGPSFDCNQAVQAAERAICASSELAALDQRLSTAYTARRAATTGAARAALLNDQRRWIASRDQCGGDAACLEALMTARIAELGAAPPDVITATPVPTAATNAGPVAVPVATSFGSGLRDIDPIVVDGRLLSGDPIQDLGFDAAAARVPFVRGDRPKAQVDLALAIDLALLRQWPQALEREADARDYADRFLVGAARDTYLCPDDCPRGVPYAGWRGSNEFEREAAYNAFIEEIVPRLSGQAQGFPVGIRSVHQAEVLAYDYEREGFPLRFKRDPSLPSVTAGISPVIGMSIQDTDTFADFVPVSRDAAEAWLARISAGDASGKRIAWLAVDLRLRPVEWDANRRGPVVARGIDAMRLTAAPDGGTVLHTFARPEPEAPVPEPDRVPGPVPPQAYVLTFGAEAVDRETWLELAERQIGWDQQATKDLSNGTELFAGEEVAGRDAAFAAEDMLAIYRDRLAAALAAVPDRVTVAVSQDIERHGTKWFDYEAGTLRGMRAAGRTEPWLQRIDALDEQSRMRFAPLGSRTLYRNLDLAGWLPAEGLPYSVMRMRQVRPHLALDRRLEVPPIPMERDAAEALFVPPPDCSREREVYQDAPYGSDARDAAAAALQTCNAVRQAYGDVTTTFEIEIDGARRDPEAGWVLTGRVLGATVRGPHGNTLREFAAEELPPAEDVWQARLDAEAAESWAAAAEARATAEAAAAAAAAEAAAQASVAERMAGTDLAGIRLGMPFAEAEAIVRESLDIGWVGQLSDAERAERRGEPYLDYRIFIAADGRQIFVLYQGPEGSEAADRVVAAARSLRVPGEVGEALAAQLQEKYGAPLDTVEGGTRDLIWTADVGENGLLLENAGAAVAFDHGPCSTDMTRVSRLWDSHDLLEGSEDDRAFYMLNPAEEPMLRVPTRVLEDVTVWSACGPTVVADLQQTDGRDGPVTELRYVLFDHAAYLPHHRRAIIAAEDRAPTAVLPDL